MFEFCKNKLMFVFLRCDFGEGMEHPVHRGETMPIGPHDR